MLAVWQGPHGLNRHLYTTCPKCRYERQVSDPGSPDTCPACGLVFAKWMKQSYTTETAATVIAPGGSESRVKHIFEILLKVEDRVNPVYFWGRVLLYITVLVWGWQFLQMDYVNNPFEIGRSWMHLLNLVFHEAGHIVFMPLGWLMTILGGSLGQLLMPIVVLGVFLWKSNAFGASIALWWLGQSFKDLAPYIDDALDQKLVLLGGRTGADAPGNHDWNNILGNFNVLERHREYAQIADLSGSVLLVLALLWGAVLLYRQYRNLERF